MKINPFLALVIGVIIGISIAYVGVAVGARNENAAMNAQVEQLRNQLMKEGVSFSAEVSEVYPGLGFIATDSSGEIFVEWGGVVKEKQIINVNGTLSTKFNQLKAKKGFTNELANFLNDKEFFISAKRVAVM